MASGHQPFQIIGHFATGGVANLYKVRLEDGTPALLRQLQTSKCFRLSVRKRFMVGTQYRQMLSPHPNIQNSLGNGAGFIWPYELVEFVDGVPLRTMMSLNDYRIKENAAQIICGIAKGLSWMHEHHLMHLDVKPENFLVERNNQVMGVKLTDFDLAREASDNGPHRQMGTPAFMAPEQFIKKLAYQASDVFAFGLIAYQLLTGKLAFSGKTEKKFWRHQASSKVRPRAVRELAPDVSSGLEAIVMKCLEKKLADRYQDMCQVHQALVRLKIPNII